MIASPTSTGLPVTRAQTLIICQGFLIWGEEGVAGQEEVVKEGGRGILREG